MQVEFIINIEVLRRPSKDKLENARDYAERVILQELDDLVDYNIVPEITTKVTCKPGGREGFSKEYIDSQQTVLDTE